MEIIVLLLLLHLASHFVFVTRTNAQLKRHQSSEGVPVLFMGPRGIANWLRFLFSLRFLRSGDLLLMIAGVVNLVTTLIIMVLIVMLLIQVN